MDIKIDGTQLAKFRETHGAALALRLCVFYETWNTYGEAVARDSVDRTTYYRYRKILAEAGDLDIKRYSQRRWISS